MPLTLSKRRYQELVDPVVLDKLITGFKHNDIHIPRWDVFDNMETEKTNEDYIKELIKKLEFIRKRCKNGKVAVQYDFKIPEFGRVYEQKSYASIGQLAREVRATLGYAKYVDVDINNCHPVLLVQLCNRYNIPCDELQYYVNNRDTCLRNVMDIFGCNRDLAKTLFIRVMYGGSIEAWKKAVGTTVEIPEWINRFKNCVQGVFNELISHYPDEVNKLKDYGKFKDYNRLGTAASWILQHEECRILDCMLDYLRVYKKGVNNCVLCFDGFMMLKEKYSSDLLHKIESYVEKQLGYRITLSVKQFETIDLSKIQTEEELDDDDIFYAPETSYYDHDMMLACASRMSNAYRSCKDYFERFHAYDRTTEKIVFADIRNKKIVYKSVESAKTTYGNIFYNSDSEDKPKKFIKSWIEDPERKDVDCIEELPYSGKFIVDNIFTADHHMNSFTGFNNQITNDITPEQISEGDDWFTNKFMHTLIRLCEGNEEYANWLLCFFAQIIQHPADRKDRAVVIVGEQGNGKNSILEAISRVIGDDHYSTSSDPNVYFGEHAVSHAHKLLINSDESSASASSNFAERIKTFITTDTIEINEKFVKQYVIKNYARLVATSNTTSALPIDFRSGDRRFVMFEAKRFSIDGIEYEVNTPEHSEYFKQFYKVINSTWFPRYFYDKMMSIDISTWNHDQKFDTNLKKEMTYVSQNSVEHFVSDQIIHLVEMCSDNSPFNINEDLSSEPQYIQDLCTDVFKSDKYALLCKVKGQDLYNMYVSFCDDSSLKQLSKTMFYRLLVEINRKSIFLYRYHSRSGITFIVNATTLNKYLGSQNICEF